MKISTVKKPTVAFIGAGNMASALIGGLISNGFDPKTLWASDTNAATLSSVAGKLGINTTPDNHHAVASADVIVLAVKPQQLKTVATDLSKHLNPQALVISIAAGVTTTSLGQWLGSELAVVRCMPNTPALIQLAATGLFANAQVSSEHKKLTDHIVSAIGVGFWLEKETDIDIVTALSGSGPAYFFLFIEALKAAGVTLGLDEKTANQLTLQTALGAATMAMNSEVDVTELRRRVTSPGGTTAKALEVLDQGNLHQLIQQTVTAAAVRSRELAEALDD